MAQYRGKCKEVSAARVVAYDTWCTISVEPETAKGRSMVFIVTPPEGAGPARRVNIFPNGQATIDGLPTTKKTGIIPGWYHYITSDKVDFKFAKEPANLPM